jgi:hypothetical protein
MAIIRSSHSDKLSADGIMFTAEFSNGFVMSLDKYPYEIPLGSSKSRLTNHKVIKYMKDHNVTLTGIGSSAGYEDQFGTRTGGGKVI